MHHSRRSLPSAPVALRHPREFCCHGQVLQDDYAWLRAENWKEALQNPELLPASIYQHLETENRYCNAAMWGMGLQRNIMVGEMRKRIKEDDSTPPSKDGPYAYLTRYRQGDEYPLVCRIVLKTGFEEILLDGEKMARGKEFFDLGEAAHSPDHARMVWSVDEKGSEFYTLRIRDLKTFQDLPDHIEMTSGEAVWFHNSAAFLYVELDDNHRPIRVRRHHLGEHTSRDEIVYEEKDSGWFVDIEQTQSGDYCIISVGDHETSEAYLLDLGNVKAKPVLINARQDNLLYDLEHSCDQLIVLTNADGAEDFKLVTAPLLSPQKIHWSDLVPHRPGIMILGHVVFARHLVWIEREDAKPRIVIRELKSGVEHTIAFDEEAYGLGFDPGLEYDTDLIRFTYSSMTTPAQTYDYNMLTRERILIKTQEVPSGHNPDLYETRRIFATAPDGEQVPISILRRKNTPLDGSAPCFLYGYGAYGSSISASFRTNPLSLVDRGFIYAIAHIRGGTEKGWRWYTSGKREKKVNTFTDYIACAQKLMMDQYTAPKRIIAYGGSAGGMLMGAVANMAPDIFAGIVADVPFVDVLNTMLDGDLPLTPPEWPEWGNPCQDEAAFKTILGYSPYENVKAQVYPPILAIAGLTDPRVTYWEPAKWVARLRATMTGGGPVLLHTNMKAGHGGASGRFDSLKETALVYTFAIRALEGFKDVS
jgi:oligopeptidase B